MAKVYVVGKLYGWQVNITGLSNKQDAFNVDRVTVWGNSIRCF